MKWTLMGLGLLVLIPIALVAAISVVFFGVAVVFGLLGLLLKLSPIILIAAAVYWFFIRDRRLHSYRRW